MTSDERMTSAEWRR